MYYSSSSDPLPREEFGGLAAGQTLVTATRGITANDPRPRHRVGRNSSQGHVVRVIALSSST